MPFRFKIIYTIVFFTNILFSQNYRLPGVIAQTPTTAELEKYGEYPINNYSGVPNITIPLYTVKSGDIMLPISLSYHASGIKQAQEASWVGLGWSLNAGGNISKQTKVFDDFGSTPDQYDIGYFFNLKPTIPLRPENIIDRNTFSLAQRQQYSAFDNQRDFAPDLYFFNFSNYSGQFILDDFPNGISTKQSDGLKFLCNVKGRTSRVPHTGINDDGFEVADLKGNKYSFYYRERNLSKTAIGNISNINTKIVNAAWHLTNIASPKGDSINFSYLKYPSFHVKSIAQERLETTVPQTGSIRQTRFGPRRNVLELECGIESDTKCNSARTIVRTYWQARSTNITSWSTYDVFHLNNISFPNGYIKFIVSDRDDLDTGDEKKAKKLERIEIYDKTGVLIKGFHFNYNYFGGSTSNNNLLPLSKASTKKLKLKSVTEFNMINNTKVLKKPYKFQYIENKDPSKRYLIDKDSKSVDPWGYPTKGKDRFGSDIFATNFFNTNPVKTINTNDTEMVYSELPFKDISTHRAGLKFESAGLFQYFNTVDTIASQNNILNKIIYPTGGYTNFEFENNTYSNKYYLKKDFFLYPTASINCNSNLGLEKDEFFSILENKVEKLYAQKFVTANIGLDNFNGSKKEFSLTNRTEFPLFFRYEPNQKADLHKYLSIRPQGVLKTKDGKRLITIKYDHAYSNRELYPYLKSPFSSSYETFKYISLPAGDYVLEIENFSNDNKSFTKLSMVCREPVDIINHKGPREIIGGGLRIKNIENRDSNDMLLQKTNFDYSDGNSSSGILMSPVQNEYFTCYDYFPDTDVDTSEYLHNTDYNLNNHCHVASVTRTYTHPLPNIPMLLSSNRSSIGYKKVSVSKIDGNNQTLGKTIYRYKAQEDELSQYSRRVKKIHQDNGQLLSIEHINKNGLSVYKKENIYSKANTDRYMYGISILWNNQENPRVFYNWNHSTFRDYKIKSEWWHLDQSKEYFTHQSGLHNLETLSAAQIKTLEILLGEYFPDPIVTKTIKYEYKNNKSFLPTKTNVTTSKGDQVETIVHYPNDIDNRNTLTLGGPLTQEEFNAIKRLKTVTEDYQPANPIQTETTKNGSTFIERMHYGIFVIGDNKNTVSTSLLKGNSTAINSNPLEKQSEYLRYDKYGNPLEIKKENGMHIIYLWGYQGEYLIAKIENASYTSLPESIAGDNGLFNQAINLSNDDTNVTAEMQLLDKLSQIRNHNVLSNAMVTTYTYDLLIGMTSITDPKGSKTSYNYDVHNRLHQAKDNQSNIIYKNQYHYKN